MKRRQRVYISLITRNLRSLQKGGVVERRQRYGHEEEETASISYLAGVGAGADAVAAHVVAGAAAHEARARLGGAQAKKIEQTPLTLYSAYDKEYSMCLRTMYASANNPPTPTRRAVHAYGKGDETKAKSVCLAIPVE